MATEFMAAKPKILVSISSANHKRFHSITVNSVRIWLGGKIWQTDIQSANRTNA